MFFLFSKSIPQNPSANRDPQVSKAVYKFNRSISKAGLIPTRDLRRTGDEIDFLKCLLGKKWKTSYLDKEQAARTVRAAWLPSARIRQRRNFSLPRQKLSAKDPQG